MKQFLEKNPSSYTMITVLKVKKNLLPSINPYNRFSSKTTAHQIQEIIENMQKRFPKRQWAEFVPVSFSLANTVINRVEKGMRN